MTNAGVLVMPTGVPRRRRAATRRSAVAGGAIRSLTAATNVELSWSEVRNGRVQSHQDRWRAGPVRQTVRHVRPIIATILAPAELPHSEYPAVVTPREPAFRKT